LKKILINGYFLCRNLTGIERYAIEITKRLDQLSRAGEIAIIIPKDMVKIPEYKNIHVIRHGKMVQHIRWQMVTLQLFLITHRQYIVLDFGNTALPFSPGIIFLHDIYCELFPEDFTEKRDKMIRTYNCWQYRLISKYAKKIITVSQYIKNEICKSFNADPSKINVIYSSADHMRFINADMSIFDDFPVLAERPFYFSLGSLSKRKNIRWILEYADKHAEANFVISGMSLSTVKVDELNKGIPENIILLGYLNDSRVKAMMQKCKAFILPSYYEGFGLTPLEALACGAQIIVANVASLPEIYGNTAHYIDPFDTNIDLEELIKQPVDKPDKILAKYSYDTATRQVYNIIREYTI
jgi:glycosyltransferase involved in cell wall biosynthesis